MTRLFIEIENGKYQGILPEPFRTMSGILDYDFSILDPCHRPWTCITNKDEEIIEITESAYCLLHEGSLITQVLVPKDTFPNIYEAIILLGQAQLTGTRVAKYMTVYQAYESIVTDRELSFSAIRHALSHASTSLSRKSTVNELDRIFESTQIDFKIYRHLKEFYVHLGRLLIATDIALLNKLVFIKDELPKSQPFPVEELDVV